VGYVRHDDGVVDLDERRRLEDDLVEGSEVVAVKAQGRLEAAVDTCLESAGGRPVPISMFSSGIAYSARPTASRACSSEENICHRAISLWRTVNMNVATASIGAPLVFPRPR
jgi:hypothetical protein